MEGLLLLPLRSFAAPVRYSSGSKERKPVVCIPIEIPVENALPSPQEAEISARLFLYLRGRLIFFQLDFTDSPLARRCRIEST